MFGLRCFPVIIHDVIMDATSLPVCSLHSDWFVLVVLTFDNKDFLSRNCHHINEIFQDNCGDT